MGRNLNRALAIFTGLLAALGIEGVAHAAPKSMLLFRPSAAATQANPPGTAVVRRRPVAIDTQGLEQMRSGDTILFNLFDDVAVNAKIEKFQQSAPGTYHWQGQFENNPHSAFLLVMHDGAVAGIMTIPSVGDFRIHSTRDRGQVVDELNESAFPPCGVKAAQVVNAQNQNKTAPLGPAQTSCFTYIDVMIVYTAQARDLEGSDSAIQSIALLAVDKTNFAYNNSEIFARVRLVYTGLVDYKETGSFDTELNRLTDPSDGYIDDVHMLRDQYGADAVDLLISHTEGGTICGIAWLMSPVSPSFENMAFSVCNVDCAASNDTYSHELGHNLGCHHDRDNATGMPAFDYSYGYRFTGDDMVLYRTIMSYAPGNRISYFSNPNLVYQGQPLGLPEGHTDKNGQPDSADNARTINLTADTVAAFRPAVGGSGNPPLSWGNPVIIQPDDLQPGDQFGESVAISGDLMIVGSYLDDNFDLNLTDAGSAYIYRRDRTGAWHLEQKITPDDPHAGDRFGIAVDIRDSGDFNGIALVGAYLSDQGGRDSGSAYVFRSYGGVWIQEAKLTAPDQAPNDQFGRGVSIAKGTTDERVLIGSFLDDTVSVNTGSAYVFDFDGVQWNYETKFYPNDVANSDEFGISVAMGRSPSTGEMIAVVGSWLDDNLLFINSGSAYVFHETKTGWQQLAKLLPPNSVTSDQFGFSVDLDVSGPTAQAIVGSWNFDASSTLTNSGAAYVYRESGMNWNLEGILSPQDPQMNAHFGNAVAISGDTAMVGAYQFDDTTQMLTDIGAVYTFHKQGLSWAPESKILAPAPAMPDQFGFSIALEGNLAAIGAWQTAFPAIPNPYPVAGAVYVLGALPLNDCNHNGILDDCDIAYGTSLDANGNGIPDECEAPACPPDIAPQPSGDGVVNVADLLGIINSWGPCPAPPATCNADIAPSGAPDGVVNVADLLAIINAWGPCQ